MRKLLAVLWLLIPVGLIAYHYGPGQAKLQPRSRGPAAGLRARGGSSARIGRARTKPTASALHELPDGDKDARLMTRLSQAKTRMYFGELPEAMEDVETLLADASTETDQPRSSRTRSARPPARCTTTSPG